MVIAYAVQSSWHAKVIEIKPPLQTVSAESIGPHAEVRPNPVTGIKKREYEIGNEYVPREPDIPCLMTNKQAIPDNEVSIQVGFRIGEIFKTTCACPLIICDECRQRSRRECNG